MGVSQESLNLIVTIIQIKIVSRIDKPAKILMGMSL